GYQPGAAITGIQSDIHLYPVWQPITHKVRFLDGSQEALPAATVNHGGKVLPAQALADTGDKTFVGWYYNGAPFNWETAIEKDYDLIAEWAVKATPPQPTPTPEPSPQATQEATPTPKPSATGDDCDAGDADACQSATPTPSETAKKKDLAYTGSDVLGLLAPALALAVLGGTALLARRRR
ncbi:MAG: hypothetical protein LBQ92_05650, partial [Propionibacteriaceae bacterium]|nr:hypothetical protein [Propionibacteriaceae bacterium]